MTSRESINWLDAVINDPKTCGGNLEENNQALKTIKEELDVLEIFKRLVTSEEVWKDVEFGTDENRLYIDGDVHYKNEEEKELFKKWLNSEINKR